MVVLGWLVIMAGTEEAKTSVSVTNRVIRCNEMGGRGCGIGNGGYITDV